MLKPFDKTSVDDGTDDNNGSFPYKVITRNAPFPRYRTLKFWKNNMENIFLKKQY